MSLEIAEAIDFLKTNNVSTICNHIGNERDTFTFVGFVLQRVIKNDF